MFFFGGLDFVSHSFAYVAHYMNFFRDVWIQTISAAVASERATNLATHPPPIPQKWISIESKCGQTEYENTSFV
jgi:hypothetical protein